MGIFHQDVTVDNGGAHWDRGDSRTILTSGSPYQLANLQTNAWQIQNATGSSIANMDTQAQNTLSFGEVGYDLDIGFVGTGRVTSQQAFHMFRNGETVDDSDSGIVVRKTAATWDACFWDNSAGEWVFADIDNGAGAEPLQVDDVTINAYSVAHMLGTTLEPTASNPGGATTLWSNSSDSNALYYGASAAGATPSLQEAYDAGSTIVLDASGAVALTHNSTVGTTHAAISIAYPAAAYSGTASPHGIVIDWTGATSLNSSADVYGVNLIGETNAHASGESIAINVDSAWDQGIVCAAVSSFPGTGSSGSQRIGANSVADAQNATAFGDTADAGGVSGNAFGFNANAAGNSSIAFGSNTDATTEGSVAIGDVAQATSGVYAFAIGRNSIVSASYGMAFGREATVLHTNSIAFGNYAASTSSGQFVVGSASIPILTMFLGEGVSSATPQDFTINATSSSAAAVDGASLIIAAGKTVAGDVGVGGRLVFQTGPEASLIERMRIQNDGTIDLGDNGSTISYTTTLRLNAGTGAAAAEASIAYDATSMNFTVPSGGSFDFSAAGFATSTILGINATTNQNLSVSVGSGATTSGGTYTTAVGASSTATLANDSAFGGGADATGGGSAAFGAHSSASGALSIAFGNSAVASSTSAIAIGQGADATQAWSMCIGENAQATHTYSLCIGHDAASTAGNQIVFGSVNHSYTTMYVGEGVSSATPQDVTIHATTSTVATVDGADLDFAAGLTVTGDTGVGGSIGFWTGAEDTLSERMRISNAGVVTVGGAQAAGVPALIIDSASTLDPAMQWASAGTSQWSMGYDNSVGDRFILAKGAWSGVLSNIALNVDVANSRVAWGSNNQDFTDFYFGRGVTSTAPAGVTLHGTGSSVNTQNGTTLTIAGGVTVAGGAGVGGELAFQTAATDTLTERLRIKNDGEIWISNTGALIEFQQSVGNFANIQCAIRDSDTQGQALYLSAGAAGPVSATNGLVGGEVRLVAGAGAAGDATYSAGKGGDVGLVAANAGTAAAGGGADGGSVYLDVGAPSGSGTYPGQILFHAQGGTRTSDNVWRFSTGSVSTTNNTATTIITLNPTDNKRGALFIDASANDTTNSRGAAFTMLVGWSKASGTAAITTSSQVHSVQVGSLGGISVTVSSGTILIQVTGDTSTNVEWEAIVKWNEVS
jgi:hypothetical protein